MRINEAPKEIWEYVGIYRKRRKWMSIIAFLAAAVAFGTMSILTFPAATMEETSYCGVEAHTHNEECFEQSLTCTISEEGHVHTDECYKTDLVCEKTEHEHSLACFADENADVESQEAWERSIADVELTGSWTEDAAAIAKSQLGYAESSRNYIVAEDGMTKKGYTRYGAWYGDNYIDWDSAFAAFVMSYAQIPEEVFPIRPEGMDAGNWMKELEEYELLGGADEQPQVGDLVFFEKTENEEIENSVGIISDIKKDLKEEITYIKVIEGDYRSGDRDMVKENRYAYTDSSIKGYGLLSEAEQIYKSVMEEDNGVSFMAENGDGAGQQGNGVSPQNTDKTGEESDKVSLLSNGTSTDLTNYITDATVKKVVDGNWQESTTFKEGDQVRVEIDYTLPVGTLGLENNVFTYQLPHGIIPAENIMNRPIYEDDDGRVVGFMSVTTDGLVTIIFNQDYANEGLRYRGSFWFTGTATTEGLGNDGEVSFGGSTGTVTIEKEKEKQDFAIYKQVTNKELNGDTGSIDYKIIVSSNNGSPGTIDVADTISGGSYKSQTFKVKKYKADGTSETVNISPDIGDKNFAINNLPKLEKGERYEIEYCVDYNYSDIEKDGSAQISNNVKGSSGGEDKWSSITTDLTKYGLNKGGSYDSYNDVINWTITITNNWKTDLSGLIVTDQLPDDLVGDVVLTDESGNRVDKIPVGPDRTLQYTFPKGSTSGSYYINYTTRAEGHKNGEVVTNKVTFDGDEASSNVTVVHRDWNLNKSWLSSESADEDGRLPYRWRVSIDLPNSPVGEVKYADVIYDAVDNSSKESKPDTHYTTIDAVEAGLRSIVWTGSDGTQIGYDELIEQGVQFDVMYYGDEYGTKEINPEFNRNAEVKKFVLTITDKNGKQLSGRNLYFTYSTFVDYSGMAGGDKWTFKNSGSIPEHESEASDTHIKSKKIEKEVVRFQKSPYNPVKAEGYPIDGYIEYDEENDETGTFYYRILLRTDWDDNNTITLQDHMPAGMQLEEIYGYFYESDYNYYTGEGQVSNYDFRTNGILTCSDQVNSDGSKTYTINIESGYNYDRQNDRDNRRDTFGASETLGHGNTLALIYKVSIVGDGVWQDPTIELKRYTNEIEWVEENESDSKTVNVEREIEKVVKRGTRRENSYIVDFNVEINPGATDIDPTSNTITLKDTLSILNNKQIYAKLILNPPPKLYKYNEGASDHRGEELNPSYYQVGYNSLTHEITLTLPDSLACVFTYSYSFDPGSTVGDFSYKNAVTMTGGFSTEESKVITEVDAGGNVGSNELNIYKVDADNVMTKLEGAEFTLQERDPEWMNSWTTIRSLSSDKNGKLSISLDELEENTLYRITETKAPAGYIESEESVYFVLGRYDKDSSKLPSEEISKIQYLSTNGGDIYIPNESYANVTVNKVWKDQGGNTLDVNDKEVKVQLYRHQTEAKGHTVTWSSEQPGFVQTNKYGSFKVADRSRLILRFPEAKWNDKPVLEIRYLNEQKEVVETERYEVPDQGQASSYTLKRKIESDVEISVINIDGEARKVEFSGYDQPFGYDVTGEPEKVGEITLSAAKEWKWAYTWKNLEKEDKNGNPYYYSVEEVDPSSDVQVSYSSNNGSITSGTITVTNTTTTTTEPEDYELPKTGGTGTIPYTIAGLGVMLTAGVMYRKKFRKGGHGFFGN